MSLTAEPFGALPDGSPVIRHTLSRTGGLTLRVLTYGGIVQSLEVPDARARVTNVVLGFTSLDGYLKASDAYFGGLVGRFADRLAGGRFTLRTPHAHDALRQAGQGDLVSLWGDRRATIQAPFTCDNCGLLKVSGIASDGRGDHGSPGVGRLKRVLNLPRDGARGSMI